MKIALTIVGFLIGLYLAEVGREMLGLGLGAFVGWMLGKVIELQRRITSLEQQLDLGDAAREPQLDPDPHAAEGRQPEAPVDEPASPSMAAAAAQPDSEDWREFEPAAESEADPDPWLNTPREPSHVEIALTAAKRWLTTGNIPVKLGVIISFFGVAFLFKFAIDRQLLVLPIELRLLAVATAGIAVLILGWRLRHKMPVYGLTLQGGGIGVMYLTIFAGFRLYGVLPSALAFVLLIGLTISAGILAVIQNAKALAILGIAGGFLAPVLISTGGGSHVGLFSYYLLLNLAVLGIAWHRSWRELNLVGFIFTFTIGGLWGYRTYQPELFASTEPFLIAFFVLYQAIAVLFALRQPTRLRGVVDGTLVFGTPVIAFAMQAVMLRDSEYGLAVSALILALAYAIGATAMLRSKPDVLKVLAEAYIALAVAFATLAIPLALDARWTAGAWALEGAALVWVGMRQHSMLSRFAGVALIGFAGFAFGDQGWQPQRGMPGLNGNVLGGVLISLAAFFASRYIAKESTKWVFLHRITAAGLMVWAMGWWLWTGLYEIDERVVRLLKPVSFTAFITISAALLWFTASRLQWRMAALGSFVLLPMLLLPAGWYVFVGHHPAAHLGWLAWPAALAMQWRVLRSYETTFPRLSFLTHALTALFFSALVIWETGWQLDQAGLNETWMFSAMTAVPGLIVFAMLNWHRWPVAQNWGAYVGLAGGCLVALAVFMAVAVTVDIAGNFAPLPYVPILNPLDLVAAFTLLVAFAWLVNLKDRISWLSPERFPSRMAALRGALALAAFIGSSMMVLRAAHHYGGVRWDADAMFDSVLVQAALSIYWGLLALISMVLGAKRKQRFVWLCGAALMGVVVAKLFLVELGNSGTIARIVSFIGIGVLLLIIGYFAPAPPRQSSDETDDQDLREDDVKPQPGQAQ